LRYVNAMAVPSRYEGRLCGAITQDTPLGAVLAERKHSLHCYDRDRFPMRETSHDDTDSSRLLANCHRTNDARGCGGNRGDIYRLALRFLSKAPRTL
jgi:hypothetical protein